jgi:hypothetical protein
MRVLTMKYFWLAVAVGVLVLVFPLADHGQNTVCTGTCGQPSAECSKYCYEHCHKGMCGMVVCSPAHRHR